MVNYKVVNLKTLVKYFDENFYIFSRMKNINIKSNIYTNDIGISIEDEIILHYEYLRVVLFNLYIFFLNNSMNKEIEKDLFINITLEKYTEEKNEKEFQDYDLAIKISVSIKDKHFKFDFCDLNNIFSKYNFLNNLKNEINLIKLLDCGIVTTFFIPKVIYKTEFNLIKKENNNYLNLTILAMSKDLYNKNYFNKEILVKKFIEPKEEISEDYFVKILANNYNFSCKPKKKQNKIDDNESTIDLDGSIEELNFEENNLCYESDTDKIDEKKNDLDKSKNFFLFS